MNLPGSPRINGTIVSLAAVLAALACYLVVLDRVSAQQATQGQYAPDEGSPPPEQPADKVTICHATGNGGYVAITVDSDATYGGHGNHPNDIIPAPPGGCPAGPPEPTTPEPTATASASATPEPTSPQPTTGSATASATTEPTDDGGDCPVPEPTTALPSASASATASPNGSPEPTATGSATASPAGEPTNGVTTPEPTGDVSPSAADASDASPSFISTPTAIATNPGETPGGVFEVADPEGTASTLSLYDLDVGDDPPLPGGPGGVTRSERLGQRAAAQALLEGGDFHRAVAAAQPYLNACDSRDAVRLAAVQLGVPLPDTGGPRSLAIAAAMALVGSGIISWRLTRR